MNQPLDLILLFADKDAENFVCRLIERGVERGCLRPVQWMAVREPMRDAKVVRAPATALGPHIANPTARFVVLWDHQGSGCEHERPDVVEQRVLGELERSGIDRSRAVAIALDPELEVVLVPVWSRVLGELAGLRNQSTPTVPVDPHDPKASLGEALRLCRLRASPALFEDLAGVLSLRGLKTGGGLAKLSVALVEWFGAAA